MSDTKFTPGPWELLNGGDIFGPSGGDSGDGVCADQDDGWQVAEVGWYAAFVDGQLTELSGEVRKKNIAILLSAPDLYDALDGLMMHFLADDSGQLPPDLYDSPFYNEDLRELYSKARAALAKARGES